MSQPICCNGWVFLFIIMEIWKKIKDFNGFYEVSNFGNIRNKEGNLEIKELKSGYCMVYIKHEKKCFPVHRLVAKEFIADFDNKKMVNHIDFNKKNNHLSNLEMVSNRENQCHSVKAKNKLIGISYHIRLKKWTAQIMINGKLKYIGRYNNQQEAYQARVNFEKDNGIINKYI